MLIFSSDTQLRKMLAVMVAGRLVPYRQTDRQASKQTNSEEKKNSFPGAKEECFSWSTSSPA